MRRLPRRHGRRLALSLYSLASWWVPNLARADEALTQGARAAPAIASPRPARPAVEPRLDSVAKRLLAQARPLLGGLIAIDVRSGRFLSWQSFQRTPTEASPLAHVLAPAASLFKLVTAIALLERTPVTPATPVCIRGGRHAIRRQHLTPPPPPPPTRCHPFSDALGFSRNAVFAQLASRHLRPKDLRDVAGRLGFNRASTFPGAPLLGTFEPPDDDLGFARAAAGFVGSRLSVLGAARLAQIIASDGRPRDLQMDSRQTRPAKRRIVRSTTARRLSRMMEVTVHSGTSLRAFTNGRGGSYLGGVRVAAKTGTLADAPGGPTNSWFIAFAPSRSPRLALAVLLRNAPVWRRKANEVGRDFLRAYFHSQRGVSHPFPE